MIMMVIQLVARSGAVPWGIGGLCSSFNFENQYLYNTMLQKVDLF